nr:MAG TPA: Multidrug Resistance efflux pump [Caudoviricetes sp.]
MALCVLIEELLVCTRCKLVVNLLADLIVHIHYSYIEINLNTILVYYHFSHFFYPPFL